MFTLIGKNIKALFHCYLLVHVKQNLLVAPISLKDSTYIFI